MKYRKSGYQGIGVQDIRGTGNQEIRGIKNIQSPFSRGQVLNKECRTSKSIRTFAEGIFHKKTGNLAGNTCIETAGML